MKQFKAFESTYYRGHAPDIDPSTPNDKGITWITPSKKLASTYGDKISKVEYSLKGRRLIIPEINVVGNILDLLKSVETLPRNTKQQKQIIENILLCQLALKARKKSVANNKY